MIYLIDKTHFKKEHNINRYCISMVTVITKIEIKKRD